MNDKRQLLCTFSTLTSFKTNIDDIKKFYTVQSNRFFVFTNVNKPKEVFITYNILSDNKHVPKFANTISVHRKKQFNVLYSLNAMNTIIKDENGGVFDKSYIIDWSLYADSLVISTSGIIRIIPIKMLEIIN